MAVRFDTVKRIMIVWADHSWPIGQRQSGVGNGVEDIEGTKHYMPFLVLREATLEEWHAEYKADGGAGDARPFFRLQPHVRFYEISVD